MSSFFEYMYGINKTSSAEKVVEDKAPKKKSLTGGYFVFCNDQDGTLRRLIEAIGKHGNGGHSYEIVLDPDYKEEKESFFWDGDGSDRINSIIAIPEGDGKENPLLRMCLQTLDSINMQAKELSREKEEWGEPPPSVEEKKHIIDDIIHDTHLILKGANYEDCSRRAINSIKEYCDMCLEGLKEGNSNYESDKNLTVEEVVKHIKEMANEGLEKGISFLE